MRDKQKYRERVCVIVLGEAARMRVGLNDFRIWNREGRIGPNDFRMWNREGRIKPNDYFIDRIVIRVSVKKSHNNLIVCENN